MLPEELARSGRRAELEVLVACSHVALTPEDTARLAAALAVDLDWDYLLRTANVNGILPLVFSLKQNFECKIDQINKSPN